MIDWKKIDHDDPETFPPYDTYFIFYWAKYRGTFKQKDYFYNPEFHVSIRIPSGNSRKLKIEYFNLSAEGIMVIAYAELLKPYFDNIVIYIYIYYNWKIKIFKCKNINNFLRELDLVKL